ncbi:hypothetical protein Tco_0090212 [Tanacetum coccineum]
MKDLHDTKSIKALDIAQKAKVYWSIEGDENSKYFHGILNKKRSHDAIRGILIDEEWLVDPCKVNDEFLNHFASCFSKPENFRIKLGTVFPNRLSLNQLKDLERVVTYDEIKRVVWDYGSNKSPGPDGFTFEFFRRY